MVDQDARRKVVEAVFASTGEALSEKDPLVVATLFYADTVRAAAREAVSIILAAGDSQRAAVERTGAEQRAANESAAAGQRVALEEAQLLLRKLAAERKAMGEDLEKRIQQCMRQAVTGEPAKIQSRRTALQILGAVAAGVVLTAAVEFMMFGLSFSWVNDMQVGRAFLRAAPSLDPDLRNRLIKHFEKQH
jgi:Fe2+ transport system protein B